LNKFHRLKEEQSDFEIAAINRINEENAKMKPSTSEKMPINK
jgi:hypothetical protein